VNYSQRRKIAEYKKAKHEGTYCRAIRCPHCGRSMPLLGIDFIGEPIVPTHLGKDGRVCQYDNGENEPVMKMDDKWGRQHDGFPKHRARKPLLVVDA